MKRSASRPTTRTGADPSPPAPVNEIRFYRANERPYGAFSNLFRRPIDFEGREFPTAEHAYQAGKARKEERRPMP